MAYAPRTIAYFCELLHPPQAPDPAVFQRVHNRLFQAGSPPYQSFHVLPQGALLANPAEQRGMESQVALLPDRVRFAEQGTGLTTEEFAQRVEHTLDALLAERPVPVFLATGILIRTLINPKNPPQSLEFLAKRVLDLEQELSEFERPIAGVGLRFSLPGTPTEPQAYTLRIESWPADPRCLWIEVLGQFPAFVSAGEGPLPVISEPSPLLPPTQGGPRPLTGWIQETYRFATVRAPRFVARFDQKTGP
jgi:hypothetical protein